MGSTVDVEYGAIYGSSIASVTDFVESIAAQFWVKTFDVVRFLKMVSSV